MATTQRLLQSLVSVVRAIDVITVKDKKIRQAGKNSGLIFNYQ